MGNSARTKRGGEYVYDALVDAGIELLVGLPGTQTLPLDRVVVQRDEMRYVMARHETAIPHVAWGYYESSGVPAATLTVPGPGDTNVMHGLKNALEDSVPIVHVAADVNPDERGKKPIHEIESGTFDTVVKENVVVTDATDLPAAIDRGIERALTPPKGPVRLGVPSGVLAAEFDAPEASVTPEHVSRNNGSRLDAAADALADASRPVVYVGGGARRSEGGAESVRALIDALDAPVITSYKGKGVVPEDDPRWLGVTGSHLPPGARRALEAADVVYAVGTDFDGVTTDHWEMPMGDRLVHVTLDPDAIDASYAADIGIVADAATATDAIRNRLEGRDGSGSDPERWDGAEVAGAVRREYDDQLRSAGLLADGSPLHTPRVLRTVRETIPDDSIVTTDVGGFRVWSLQTFEAHTSETFVTAGSWAGMGIGLPAAIGAKLANPDLPVVSLSGDGGLLMCLHELHTAAQYDLDIVLIVSNNSDYGIISKSPKIREYTEDHAFTWDAPAFPAIAEGFGWVGESVATTGELETAIDDAVARDRPTLIDVDVRTDEPTAAGGADYETELSF